MRPSGNTAAPTSKRISFKRALCIILSVLTSLLCFGGCSADNMTKVEISGADAQFDMTPCKNTETDKPFCIAVIDEAPPIESSYLWLYGIAEQLQTMDYISSSVDLSSAPKDFDGLYNFLITTDLGDYIRFDSEYYLVGEDKDDEVAKKLTDKIANKEIDIIAATGTKPGTFLKELDPDVPFLVSMATDPVASGIIESVENSGDDDIWALVEPNPMKRQLEAYYDMFGIKKLGMLTIEEYEEIAAVPEYEEMAGELGIKIVKESIHESDLKDQNCKNIVRNKAKSLADRGIDALLLTYYVLDDDAGLLTDILADKKIPYLISDGDYLVEQGGLICLSCYDYEGYGKYAAMVMSNIFHGQKACDQPNVYTSTVHIALNVTTARKTGIKTDIELLQSADKIYR